MNKILLLIAFSFLAFNISCKKNTTSSQNTAPIASFSINPTSGTTATTFVFDASSCSDNEDATSALEVRWDWNNDGTRDTDYSTTKTATHQYNTTGIYTIKLEVKDSEGLTNTATMTVSILLQSIIVTFPDANFEALIRESLNIPIGDIMNTDLITINTLSGSDKGITNISGIEYCTNLENLYLEKNSISEISALSSLIKLKILKLYNNFAIINISVLENLIDLEQLFLTGNLITDLTPISGLNNLTVLLIGGNPLDDISIVSNLTQLQALYLGNSHIGNISALSNLTNLKTLDLNDTQITDLTPLTGLINLERLWVSSNNLSDIYTLASLTNLKFLHIANTNTISISDLTGLVNLTSLYIFNNQIVDISPLSGLINLTNVNMWGNQIVNISPLSGLTNLESVNINENIVTDILPLVNNTGIDNGDSIWLENNPLSEASINTYIPQLEARGVTVTY